MYLINRKMKKEKKMLKDSCGRGDNQTLQWAHFLISLFHQTPQVEPISHASITHKELNDKHLI